MLWRGVFYFGVVFGGFLLGVCFCFSSVFKCKKAGEHRFDFSEARTPHFLFTQL